MSEGDGTSVGVDLLVRELEVVDRHDGLRGEGFVDFEKVDWAKSAEISFRRDRVDRRDHPPSSAEIPTLERTLGIANAGPIPFRK